MGWCVDQFEQRAPLVNEDVTVKVIRLNQDSYSPVVANFARVVEGRSQDILELFLICLVLIEVSELGVKHVDSLDVLCGKLLYQLIVVEGESKSEGLFKLQVKLIGSLYEA